MLTLYPEDRRNVLRLLGEIEAVERQEEGGPGGRSERDSPVVRVLGRRLGPSSSPSLWPQASLDRSRLRSVATLASFPAMMQRDRKREDLRLCGAAWLVGVSVREYREIEAGERMPSPDAGGDEAAEQRLGGRAKREGSFISALSRQPDR